MNAFLVACRSLARRPGFTFVSTLTLALGIGATTAMFSVVDTVLIRSLPFPNADNLVRVMEASPGGRQQVSLVAPARLEDWNRAARSFDGLTGAYAESVTETSGAEPERLEGQRVAPRFFGVFGMSPLVGRTFTSDEERFGGPLVAVISERFWLRRYGRDSPAVGRRLVLGGVGYSVVGVMPRAFTSATTDVWLPAQFAPGLIRIREARFMSGVGRMKPGVTIERAAADLGQVQLALGEQYPASDKGWSVEVRSMKDFRVGEYRRALTIVFAAVSLLLAIAVANIAGLMLVQLRRRTRELSIRQAIGGSRSQLVSALMREVLVIAAAGSLAGGVAAFWLVGLFARMFATVPRMNELALDWRALGFAAATSGSTALIFGLWPVLHATRGDLAPALTEGGRGGSAARHRLQHALVVCQIALSILLIASAGLMLRSYYNLGHVDLGFSTDRAVTFHVGAAWDEDRARVGHLQERLVSEITRLPGVTAVGFANFLPATGGTLRYQGVLEGVATVEDKGKITVGSRNISSAYLPALGVPLIAGAWCPTTRFDFRAPVKAIVNQAFAERYGPDLLGRHFTLDSVPIPLEIVGIVGNLIEDGPGAPSAPYVYGCNSAESWPDPEYVVRTRGDAGAAMAAVRQIVHGLDPNRAIFGMRRLEEVVASALDQPRLNASVLTLFAAAAMTLASLGLYTLLMLWVSERSRELGVRMALGAAPRQVVGLVLAGASRLLTAGIAAGLILSFAVARALRTVLFGVSPLDALTLTAAVVALMTVGLVAAVLPARRAAAIDPIEAMRAE